MMCIERIREEVEDQEALSIEGNTREAYEAAFNATITQANFNFTQIDELNAQMPLLDYQSEQNSS